MAEVMDMTELQGILIITKSNPGANRVNINQSTVGLWDGSNLVTGVWVGNEDSSAKYYLRTGHMHYLFGLTCENFIDENLKVSKGV
jgi:hypothetical protein